MYGAYGRDHRKHMCTFKRHRDETSMFLVAGNLFALVYMLLSPSFSSFEICVAAAMIGFFYFMKKVL